MNVSRLVNYQQCWFGSSLQILVFKQVVSHKNVNCEGENKSLFSAFCFYSSFIFLFFVGLPLFLFFLYPRLTPVGPLVWFLDLVSPISSFFAPFQVTWLFCLKLPSLKPSSASPTLPLSRVLPAHLPFCHCILSSSPWPLKACRWGDLLRNIHHPKTESHLDFILTIK